MKPRRTTALGIPCPWDGDENNPIPWTYHVWHWLYRNTRKLRHLFELHDWEPWGDRTQRCTWCGEGR